MSKPVSLQDFGNSNMQIAILDFAAAVQLDLTGSSVAQISTMPVSLVYLCASGGDLRITKGATPTASAGAGSVTLKDGATCWLAKLPEEKIAASGTGKLDIIPALSK